MAIYIIINKSYETTESVAYMYSPDGNAWGEFLISKNNLEPQLIKGVDGEKNNFYLLRAWSTVRKEYMSNGIFPEETCYAA
ncbi:hypothetical protein DUP93_09720 [Salmonella enterica subsp. enterica serovar Toulon]|nr:hypothetical protein [Salmonella enterica subsp. enterica serovar Toulon]